MSKPDTKSELGVTVHAARLDYDGLPLFHDLDFTIEPDGWTCVLGPSGVGKTSLLRLIAGLTDPWSGSAVVASDDGSLSGRTAYMAQQDLLMPWLDVCQNVMLGGRLRHEPATAERRERAEALIASVGLADKSRALPMTLSGGQRQRAALARTLMEDRPIVLMDEPFSALDTVTRHRIQELAVELLSGRTVLLVTHDPLEALRLGRKIHVMAGRPATLDLPLEPEDAAPRDLSDMRLQHLHAELLGRLAAAGGAA